MSFVLFDDPEIRVSLMPFTLTRPVACIRVGIFTIAEKWEKYLGKTLSFQTQDYLQAKFPLQHNSNATFINGAACPDPDLFEAIQNLRQGQALESDNVIVAYKGEDISEKISYTKPICIIKHNWDIFLKNGEQIRKDFEIIKTTGTSAAINDTHTAVYNPENIFIEPGAIVKAAVLNADTGPIYIGKNAEVQEGALIRGPFALGEGSVVNMGAKMRGDTTVGPFSKVGGEVSNSVIFGYSNKGHDGFIGNTVIGEWCNLGADTNTSNLKNNYSNVSLYSYKTGKPENTGQQFCGMMMGDHSKTSINSMINTGTVVGVMANIFGSGFPPKYVNSFSWGNTGTEIFELVRALDVAEKVLKRRGIELSLEDKTILTYLHAEALISLK